MSEIAVRVSSPLPPSDQLVWSVLRCWRETGDLPRGWTIRRTNYGRPIGPRAWLKFAAVVKETWRPGLVLCDYDTPQAPPWPSLVRRLKQMRLRAQWIRYDRTARGWHVVMQLRAPLTLAETIAVQAVLGSDPWREGFNLRRAVGLRRRPSSFWESRANILWERKVTHGKTRTAIGTEEYGVDPAGGGSPGD